MQDLQTMLERGAFCTLGRGGELEERSGFVVKTTPDVVVIERFLDFHSQGLSILRREDVQEVRCDARDHFFQSVVQSEELRGAGLAEDLQQVNSIADVLKFVRGRDELVAIECYALEGGDGDFVVGRVLQMENGEVAVRAVSAAGVWDLEPTCLRLEDIAEVELRSPYLRYFGRYAQSQPG